MDPEQRDGDDQPGDEPDETRENGSPLGPDDFDDAFDDVFDDVFDHDFGDADEDLDESLEPLQLDEHETELVRQDLTDLADFESAFRAEGFRGVAVWCHDCSEEHYYPWDMLRENLQLLIDTGETPVHEPAFAPEPDRYVPWDYARGYVDALRDAGLDQRLDVGRCPRCRLELTGELAQANYCPRCASPLLVQRLRTALLAHGLRPEHIDALLREAGIPS